MPIALTLPVRTWAAVDAALAFFRKAPPHIAAVQPLTRRCRQLHGALRRAGVRSRYRTIATLGPGKSLLRLQVACRPLVPRLLTLHFSQAVVRSLAGACLTIIAVLTDLETEVLLDHEAEELHATRAFLSELRREATGPLALVPDRKGKHQLSWDERRREYGFTNRTAERVSQHYRRVGASLN